jgi:HEAT repeat protein
MLRHDPNATTRAAAAEALGNYVLLGELGKIRPEPFAAAVATLRESYLDEAEQTIVQRQALEAIAYTSEGDAEELITDAYGTDDEGIRISAILAMGRSADTRWGTIIRRELSNTNPRMRLEATRASGELQMRDAVEEIIALTDDVDQRVQAMALWALGQIGGTVARKTLSRFTSSEVPDLQAAAREALQELEFFHGDTASFFGPPSEFSGGTEEQWDLPELLDDATVDGEEDDEDDDDEAWD